MSDKGLIFTMKTTIDFDRFICTFGEHIHDDRLSTNGLIFTMKTTVDFDRFICTFGEHIHDDRLPTNGKITKGLVSYLQMRHKEAKDVTDKLTQIATNSGIIDEERIARVTLQSKIRRFEMFVSFAFLICLILVTEAHLSVRCPPKDKIPSCKCDAYDSYLTVDCFDFANTSMVKPLDQYLYGNVSLTLHNLRIKRIPENFLGDIHVVHLSIYNSTVEHIDSNAFVGQIDHLRSITINNSSLQSFFSPALQNMDNMLWYYSADNKPSPSLKVIRKADTSTLPSCISLIELRAYGIESIEAEAFTRFVNLTSLDFSMNHLTSLTANSLPAPLRWFTIRQNSFSEIPIEVILSLKDLHFLSMTNNTVRKLPEESSIKELLLRGGNVYLEENPLECSCDLKWYPTYLMSHNSAIFGECRGNNTRKSLKVMDLLPFDFEDCE